jgi:hypothetical protein
VITPSDEWRDSVRAAPRTRCDRAVADAFAGLGATVRYTEKEASSAKKPV